MPNTIGKLPEFDSDGSVESGEGEEEVKQEAGDESAVEEKETQAEPPSGEQPVPEFRNEDASEIDRARQGLQTELIELRKEISELRGQRRELKQQEITHVEEQIDELKNVHPDDINLIDKILRSKGYVTKGEANQMFYEAVKQEEVTKFLDKYPEFKPENDPSDLNWNALQRELAYYRTPENPHQIGQLLERAHKAIVPSQRDQTTTARRRVETASVGAGGVGRSSSQGNKTFDSEKRAILERGGWSEEEIKRMEQNL